MNAPQFLVELLDARSPTGCEYEAQAVVDKWMEPLPITTARTSWVTALPRSIPKVAPSVLFAGHIDELGLLISYIDKDGYLYFEPLGGHDLSMISGRRVSILTTKGVVKGVTGKRAIHLMNAEDRKKVPQSHQIRTISA